MSGSADGGGASAPTQWEHDGTMRDLADRGGSPVPMPDPELRPAARRVVAAWVARPWSVQATDDAIKQLRAALAASRPPGVAPKE